MSQMRAPSRSARALWRGHVRLDRGNRQCSTPCPTNPPRRPLHLSCNSLAAGAGNGVQLPQKDDSANVTVGKVSWRPLRPKCAAFHLRLHLHTLDRSTILFPKKTVRSNQIFFANANVLVRSSIQASKAKHYSRRREGKLASPAKFQRRSGTIYSRIRSRREH